MPHSDAEWETTWKGFFDSIGGIFDAKATSLPSQKANLSRNVAPPLIGNIRDIG